MRSYLHYWNHKWAISLAAGVLLGLSYSPFPFPFPLLVIVGFCLLLRLIDLTHSAREMAYVSYAGLLTWNMITTYWLMFATVPGGIAALLANAAIMTLPLMLIWHIRKQSWPLWLSAISVSSIWLTYEFLHHQWELSWPWISLGNSFSTAPWLVQYISVTGMLGITYWIVVSAWLLYRKAHVYIILVILILPTCGSLLWYLLYNPKPDGHVEIAIIQPNYDSYLNLAGYPDAIQPLEALLETTDSTITPETKAVFWPENTIMSLIQQGNPGETDQLIRAYVSDWNIPLISGASFMHRYKSGQAPPVVRGTYGGKPYNIYNSALGYYPDGSFLFYKKAKLVPLVERFPYVNTLSRLDISGVIDWSRLAMFGRGAAHDMFDVDEYVVPAMVCYDSVFPNWVRLFVKNGAAMLVVITNDGWWGNTSGHIQHFDYARLRAVETRRTVLRSANNGISGVIHANGDVLLKTKYWTRDRFVYTVPVYEHLTFYVRYGDWPGYFAVLVTLFSIVGYRLNMKTSQKINSSE
ncbi:MAG: apolipoprotein N-acyltransferase [Balneolales bacterium]